MVVEERHHGYRLERSFEQRDRSAPATARCLVRELEPLGNDPRRDLTIVASELVANAVRHAPQVPGGQVRLVIDASDDGIRVEVHDPGQGFDPTPSAPGEGGLGLVIVSQMADEWGIDAGGHTSVWCVLRPDARTTET